MNSTIDYLNVPLEIEHFDFWKFLFEDLADPRTNNWFLIRDPLPPGLIMLLYALVVRYGPDIMKKRNAFELKYTLLIYNLMQVIFNSYLFVEGIYIWIEYSFHCEPVDYSNSASALRIARAVHLYYLAKLTELLDTVFFVLRKKNNQITFLHVYHHSVMPILAYAGTKYFPGGHGTFIGLLNTFVHIIMYFYYLMAAFGPSVQRFLWWKKYITTMQMIQFFLFCLHNSQLLFFDCGYPRWIAILITPNAALFFILFSDFYKKSYNSNMNGKNK